MISSTLIEIIFRGRIPVANLNFLSKLLTGAKEVRFNLPEISSSSKLNEIIEIFNLNDYVDLVITTDKLEIDETLVKNVFINLGKDENEFELLFYFDIKDLNNNCSKAIDQLKSWTENFATIYQFKYFVCQIDDAGEEEYYFDSNGIGPLYK